MAFQIKVWDVDLRVWNSNEGFSIQIKGLDVKQRVWNTNQGFGVEVIGSKFINGVWIDVQNIELKSMLTIENKGSEVKSKGWILESRV